MSASSRGGGGAASGAAEFLGRAGIANSRSAQRALESLVKERSLFCKGRSTTPATPPSLSGPSSPLQVVAHLLLHIPDGVG